jgi:hypothetical protein
MTMTTTNTLKLQTTTLRAILRAVSCAASTDKTRSHLGQVRFFVRDGQIIADATDGHRLHRAVTPWRAFADGELPPAEAISIPQASLAAALKAVPAPKRGQAPALAILTATGLETDAAAVRWQAADPTAFPPVEQVIPALRDAASKGDAEQCAGGWRVAPAYLIDALAACEVVETGRVQAALVQTPACSLDPARIEASGYVDGHAFAVTCVVMPVRF